MTLVRTALPQAFKRALVVSAVLHAGLLIVVAVSPSFSRPARKGLVQYVNFMGGGGGTGGAIHPQITQIGRFHGYIPLE